MQSTDRKNSPKNRVNVQRVEDFKSVIKSHLGAL